LAETAPPKEPELLYPGQVLETRDENPSHEVNSSMGFALFKLNGGYMPHMIDRVPIKMLKSPKRIKEFVENVLLNLMVAHYKGSLRHSNYTEPVYWEYS
jgi:hypothetical protein